MLGLGPGSRVNPSCRAKPLSSPACNHEVLLSAAIPNARVETVPKTAAVAAARRHPWRLIVFALALVGSPGDRLVFGNQISLGEGYCKRVPRDLVKLWQSCASGYTVPGAAGWFVARPLPGPDCRGVVKRQCTD